MTEAILIQIRDEMRGMRSDLGEVRDELGSVRDELRSHGERLDRLELHAAHTVDLLQ